MKKLFLVLATFLALSVGKASAQFEGTVGMGAHLKYGAEITSMGAGAHLHYYRTNNIRFAPSFTYYLPRKGKSLWEIEADAHFMVPLSWDISLYPIAGVNYGNWKYDAQKSTDWGDENWTKHKVGGNLGLGLQYEIGYKIRANFEFKYQFIKDFSQLNVMAGIGFWL